MTIKVTLVSEPRYKSVIVICPECGHHNFDWAEIKQTSGIIECRHCDVGLKWEED